MKTDQLGTALPAAANQPEGNVTITRGGSQPSQKGPADYFTGTVRVDPLFQPNAPARTSAGLVTFEPGARAAWHTHPLGQTLIVTAGAGRVQQWGGPIQEIRPGDVVWCPPGVKHWHGAAPTTAMTHIAIQELQEGKAVVWLEKVTDEQYGTAAASTPAATGIIANLKVAGGGSTAEDLRSVSPALAKYTQDKLFGEVWNRPGLSKRDRSVVTVSALIARNQTNMLASYLGHALDNGVKSGELSEIITHLAYYSGWGNAMAAAETAMDVFAARGIGADQLPSAEVEFLPLDEAAEAKRVATVDANIGNVAPGVVKYTTEALFRDLWLRPGLTPRDRSLVTVSALVASAHVAQITFHLNRAMDNGLTQEQASEVFTQLAFYAGWPNVMSALPVAKDVFEKRPKS